jgi:hypothetical protein
MADLGHAGINSDRIKNLPNLVSNMRLYYSEENGARASRYKQAFSYKTKGTLTLLCRLIRVVDSTLLMAATIISFGT